MNAVKVVGGLVEIGAAFKFLNTAEIALGATPDYSLVRRSGRACRSGWCWPSWRDSTCSACSAPITTTSRVGVGPIRILSRSRLPLLRALFLARPFRVSAPEQALQPVRRPDAAGRGRAEPADVDGLVQRAKGWPRSRRPQRILRRLSARKRSSHGVQWGMSYEQAIEEARATNKPVLVDFTGVNCANCRQMEREVMPGRRSASYWGSSSRSPSTRTSYRSARSHLRSESSLRGQTRCGSTRW